MLKSLEYRGYDAAGIATIDDGVLKIRKALGKLCNLGEALQQRALEGCVGIGHTRWATHGASKLENTHPIQTGKVAVVHNGIIENYCELKSELLECGYKFDGDTDTEVVPHFICHFQNRGSTLLEAVLLTVNKLKGSFALGIISETNPDTIIAVKYGLPLLVGLSSDQTACYMASDAIAVSEFCSEITYLEDKQIAVLSRNAYSIIDFTGREADNKKHGVMKSVLPNIDGFRNFMSKEIYEQPKIVTDLFAKKLDFDICNIAGQISVVGCGTSFCAALIAKYWIENQCGVRVNAEIASEFSCKEKIIADKSDLFIFISQSGETADTLAALKRVLALGADTVSVVNVPDSSIARLSRCCIVTDVGLEIAVAATKTFLAQLIILARLSGREVSNLSAIPDLISRSIQKDANILEVVKQAILPASKVIFIGRGVGYPIAIEGALKMKELSYIASEGIAAGELKHGAIALIDGQTAVIVIAPEDHTFIKMLSSIHEIKARGGIIILIASNQSIIKLQGVCDYAIEVPDMNSELEIPFIYVPILQLLAHHTALLKGFDVDKPRNLAKSVTVE